VGDSRPPTPQEVQRYDFGDADAFGRGEYVAYADHAAALAAYQREVDAQRNLAEVYGNAVAEWRPIVTEQVPALQQEVERLRARVAPLDEGPVCLLSDYQAMREHAEAAEARARELEQERDRETDLRRAAERHNTELRAALSERPFPDEIEAEARRAAFAEAAQYIRDLSVAAGRDTPDMQALADLVERLAAQAVPPGATEDK
jgi:hypothetical protein